MAHLITTSVRNIAEIHLQDINHNEFLLSSFTMCNYIRKLNTTWFCVLTLAYYLHFAYSTISLIVLKTWNYFPDKIVKILQPCKGKHTKYIYALTRITMFPDGKRVLEILEAPLSASTSLDMHRLPWDGKPVVMKAKKKDKWMIKSR